MTQGRFGGSAPPATGAPDAASSPVTPESGQTRRPSRAYEDQAYDTSLVQAPTAGKAQNKLWFNDGAWWGLLFSEERSAFTIHRLDFATQLWIDTGTLVDERASARADCLWDGSHLLVATAGSKQDAPSQAARVLRFSYDAAADRYAVDPNFPVQISEAGVDKITIAKDSTDRIWVSYIADRQVLVNHSLETPDQWGEAFVPPVESTSVAADTVAIIAFDSAIGVMWSNQTEDAVNFAVHGDAEALDAWRSTRTDVDGLAPAEDHLFLKAFSDGAGDRLFAVIKTSLGDLPGANQLAPQILLLALQPDGTWSQHVAGRVRDHQTRPILLIDGESRSLYVIATAPGAGGTIYYKRSDIDDISFPAGQGFPLLATGLHPALNDATSTKQTLDGSTELLVLASDDQTGRYVHAVLSISGGAPPERPAGAVASPPGPSGAGNDLINDTFDSLPVGEEIGQGWSLSEPNGRLSVIADVDPANHAAQLVASTPAEARVCKQFPSGISDSLTVDVDVRLGDYAPSDAALPSLRGGGHEAIAMRFSERGTFAYFDGPIKVDSGIVFAVDTWYHSTVTVDLPERSYGWQVLAESGDVLLDVAGLAWRTQETDVLDRICFETPSETIGASVDFDSVRVRAD